MKSIKSFYLVFFLMLTNLVTLAQNKVEAPKAEEAVAPENEIFTIVEQMPEFPGQYRLRERLSRARRSVETALLGVSAAAASGPAPRGRLGSHEAAAR